MTDNTNTRPSPAATDTGLETLSVELTPSGHPYMKSDQEGDYVTRSQAEELLAAERARAAEKERLRFEDDLDKWMKIIGSGITGYQPEAYALMDLACQELVTLRADNAAKDARIKELEETKAVIAADKKTLLDLAATNGDKVTALEAKLAAAEQALKTARPYVEDYDTRRHNTGVDETLTQIDAVLGGKPS